MAREDLHFRLRIPEDLKKMIESAAAAQGHSMTAEIIDRLLKSFDKPVRVSDDLLLRITMYAERQGRSASEEIERVLEREFPEQWPVDTRMQYLGDLLALLKSGSADPNIDRFIHEVQETVTGVLSGRVTGVKDEARQELHELWERYQEQIAENSERVDLDEEEAEMNLLIGRTEKMAEPLPNPRKDGLLLMDLLPPSVLSALTHKLSSGDAVGAADVLRSIDPGDLATWIHEANRPVMDLPSLDDDNIPFEE